MTLLSKADKGYVGTPLAYGHLNPRIASEPLWLEFRGDEEGISSHVVVPQVLFEMERASSFCQSAGNA